MKKILLVTLLGASVNAFAGGSAWNSDLVNPEQCVTVVGSTSAASGVATYNTKNPKCTQGVDQGHVKGVNVQGSFIYGDGSKTSFSGTVSPGHDLNLDQDMTKTNQSGAKLEASYTWAR